MRNLMITAVLATVVLVGCTSTQPMKMETMQPPGPAPELAKLEPLIGSWTGTAEIVEPSPEVMQTQMPEGETWQSTYKGGSTSTWVHEGMFVMSEGWHDMGGGKKMHVTEYVTWDAKAKKFRSWYFDDYGNYGESWWTPDDEFKHYKIKGKGFDPAGNMLTFHGEFTFVGNDQMTWNWTEKGKKGKMVLTGVSNRK